MLDESIVLFVVVCVCLFLYRDDFFVLVVTMNANNKYYSLKNIFSY